MTASEAEELCAAAVRALSGTPGFVFRGHRPHPGHTASRGVADGLALRLSRSDAALHARLRPEGPVERLLFEALEQFRAESLVPATLPGAARNLRLRHAAWGRAFLASGLPGTGHGLLLFTALEVCRARVLGVPVLAEAEEVTEAARAALGARLGRELAALRRHRDDQASYARHALAVARTVAAVLAEDGAVGRPGREPPDAHSPFALLLDGSEGGDDEGEGGGSATASGADSAARGGGYRVFTTAYDRETTAASLVRPALAEEFRARLDRRIADGRPGTARLARAWRALLAAPGPDGWDGGQEEGMVDGRALARLAVSPGERRVFRTERTGPRTDALVTFLLDCSGSMKPHRERLAALLDVWARSLELAGASCEILGFTTGAWHGGRARRDWQRAGRPPSPGRLNERLHLVVKDAGTPYRRARTGVAALLKADLYREGLDGEALEWAARRAVARPEARRLLCLVSDGGPADAATARAQPGGRSLLDAHLAAVAARIEAGREAGSRAEGALELCGLTVGGDLSPYLSRTSALDLSEPFAVTARRAPAAWRA